MRKVAMKLHTKEQAPKEGEKEAPKQGPVSMTLVSRTVARSLLPARADD